MLVGLDLDNTIVCYDGLFHRLAFERGLIPADIPLVKEAVRDHLRAAGAEDAWTELQGTVYGERMLEAEPFPGSLEFIASCVGSRVNVAIVSHRTHRPYSGPQYDLHAAARGWLETVGVTDAEKIGLGSDRVYLEETKDAKLKRIADLGCTHFVDDLPEFLTHPAFPTGVQRILFAPSSSPSAGDARAKGAVVIAESWSQIGSQVLGAPTPR
jgi:hypothetical protein